MNILYINTTNNKEIIITLQIGSTRFTHKKDISKHKAQIVLPEIITLLSQHSLTIHDINSIVVSQGSGSFTGIRVGVSIANALSYACNIPVNGISFDEHASLIEPKYAA